MEDLAHTLLGLRAVSIVGALVCLEQDWRHLGSYMHSGGPIKPNLNRVTLLQLADTVSDFQTLVLDLVHHIEGGATAPLD